MIELHKIGENESSYSFDCELITIGRSPGNMIVVEDPRISSLHGQIVKRSGDFYYQDLGSTNGSMVRHGNNDVIVDGKRHKEEKLKNEDLLMLGDIQAPVVFSFQFTKGKRKLRGGLREETIAAVRGMKDISDLGTQIVTNPLTSRSILNNLFELYGELSNLGDSRSVALRVSDFIFSNFPSTILIGVYLEFDSGKIQPLLSRTKYGDIPLLWKKVRSHLVDFLNSDEVVLTTNANGLLIPTFSGGPVPQSSITTPLAGNQIKGVFFMTSESNYTEYDLDLVTMIGHQLALALQNTVLIGNLRKAESRLKNENLYLKNVIKKKDSVEIIGESPALKKVLKQADIVARSDTTVLILGETGTGKELIAKRLHENGSRSPNIFAAVNCAAIAEGILESELFGHKRGAFTGAIRDKKGLFEVADTGTVFLDEIGDISPALQVKLLRVLENGEIFPVGGRKQIKVDVRIITATNKDLMKEVEERRFREDLFYRVNVFPINLPPLRTRAGDVSILVDYFIESFNRKMGKNVAGIDIEARKRLCAYKWPGNVRELQNELERAVLLTDDGELIGAESLSERIGGMIELPVSIGPLKNVMARLEAKYIKRALAEHKGNRTHTAKTLGISRQALTVKLSKMGLTGNRD